MTSSSFFARPAELWWPQAQPSDDLDYGIDITNPLLAVNDTVQNISFALAPSGIGEMQYANLSYLTAPNPCEVPVTRNIVSVYLSGGVVGRTYKAQIIVNGVSGRTWEWVVYIMVSLKSAILPPPPQPPTSPGYGTPIIWP